MVCAGPAHILSGPRARGPVSARERDDPGGLREGCAQRPCEPGLRADERECDAKCGPPRERECDGECARV